MRYVFLSLSFWLFVCSPALAGEGLLSGKWQCHFAENAQYLCEFRHGSYRLQLIPRYIEDHVDFRIIDDYLHDEHGNVENTKCSPGYSMYLGTPPEGLQYYLYDMQDMGKGICQYDISPQDDADSTITTYVNNFKYLNTNSIEYVAERIREFTTFFVRVHDAHSLGEWRYVRVPFGDKNYLINGLFYWRKHRAEARRRAKLHPVIRHSWHCDWQKDGRLLCDINGKDMHVLLYPQPDGENVDVYIMTALHPCPSRGMYIAFAQKKAYFSDEEAGDDVYTTGVDAKPEEELGRGWSSCGYKLVPGEAFPDGQSAIDVLSKNIMQYDIIFGDFDNGRTDMVPQGWTIGIELTDRAGLVHALQYYRRHKKAEMKPTDAKPTDAKQTGVKETDVKPSAQGAH